MRNNCGCWPVSSIWQRITLIPGDASSEGAAVVHVLDGRRQHRVGTGEAGAGRAARSKRSAPRPRSITRTAGAQGPDSPSGGSASASTECAVRSTVRQPAPRLSLRASIATTAHLIVSARTPRISIRLSTSVPASCVAEDHHVQASKRIATSPSVATRTGRQR